MKTNFSKLKLNKRAVSNLADTLKGGRAASSDFCPSEICPSKLCPSKLCQTI